MNRAHCKVRADSEQVAAREFRAPAREGSGHQPALLGRDERVRPSPPPSIGIVGETPTHRSSLDDQIESDRARLRLPRCDRPPSRPRSRRRHRHQRRRIRMLPVGIADEDPAFAACAGLRHRSRRTPPWPSAVREQHGAAIGRVGDGVRNADLLALRVQTSIEPRR